ncbi:hypothetical protein HMPREF0058_0677 [Actinomyces urogenitalis DSM 15434]|uniref:Uncharacterized protein n=1 Tax=Actinomyces urogenitalis DSM 15434 TaxID=525246 RepID=C0W483_9ACTO|nr:hypothetical protein HMPREF0058_0677 [Actinomyces urogenitalis DSM 15434]
MTLSGMHSGSWLSRGLSTLPTRFLSLYGSTLIRLAAFPLRSRQLGDCTHIPGAPGTSEHSLGRASTTSQRHSQLGRASPRPGGTPQ